MREIQENSSWSGTNFYRNPLFEKPYLIGIAVFSESQCISAPNISTAVTWILNTGNCVQDDFSPYRGGVGSGYDGDRVMEFYPGKEYGV